MLLPKHDRPEQDMIWSVSPLGGRLTPLAIDRARQRHDATLYSVAMGGMTQKQIDAVWTDWPTPVFAKGISLPRWIGRIRRAFAIRR